MASPNNTREAVDLLGKIHADDVLGPLPIKGLVPALVEITAEEQTDPSLRKLGLARVAFGMASFLGSSDPLADEGAALIYVLDPDTGVPINVRAALAALKDRAPSNVADKDLTAPPGSPTDGDRYLVATGGTGDWNGKDDNIATWTDREGGVWKFLAPTDGMEVYVEDEDEVYIRKNGAWTIRADAGAAVVDGDFAGTYAALLMRTGAGAYAPIKVNLAASSAPGPNDDSASDYGVGSLWIDTTGDRVFQCVDATATQAIWRELGPRGAQDFVSGGQFRATYDFSVDGGTQGNIDFGPFFPDKAYVKIGSIDMITALAGAGATAGLGHEAVDQLVADAAISGAPWSAAGFKDTLADGDAANFTTKATAAKQLRLVVTTADLTAGKFVVTGTYGVSEAA